MSKTFHRLLLSIFCFISIAHSEPGIFKIGAVLPLSGGLAHVGHDIQNGMLLSVKDFDNSKVKIELIFEDDQFTPTKAVTAAKKLTEQDKVQALVSLWDMADLVAITAEQHKIPHLAIRWNPTIAEKYKYSFTIESTYHTVVSEQIKLLKSIGIESLAILGMEEKSVSVASDEMENVANANGVKVVFKKLFPELDISFNSLLFNAINSKADALVFWMFPPNIQLALKKASTMKPKTLLFGMFNDLPVEDKPLANDLPFVMMFRPENWFKEKFRAAYGHDFEIRAPHAYDVTTLLANAFVSFEPTQEMSLSDHIVQFLKTIKDYPGASGTLTTNSTKNIETEVVWMIMKNGAPEELKDFDLQQLQKRINDFKTSRSMPN